MTYSHIANATLPSASLLFTSVFGMGTGGSTALSSPGVFFQFIKPSSSLLNITHKASKLLERCMVKPLGSLVLVRSMHHCTSTPSLSTS